MKTLSILASLVLAACTTSPADDDTGPAVTDGADQQLSSSHGKSDGAGTSTDPRLVNCHLEYQSSAPTWATRPAGTFDVTFGKIENEGAWAGDGAFALSVTTNPTPPYNLSLQVGIWEAATSKQLSYIVLPRPHVGGAFLFELGAQIPAVTFPETGDQAFDTMRAYCSIRVK
jgi:hypothetical protein